ncbi:hypothetical protein M9Y10_000159 [Tritrichomonas musculus]|uniref:Uncharacterized protein n=1 Tax=Tritrichomonas musculus TaxID=1915356 RepID=A0ABR2L3I5_9EUKA
MLVPKIQHKQKTDIYDLLNNTDEEIDNDTIPFNGIKFPRIPKEKLFATDDFNEIKHEEQLKVNPNSNIHKVNKNSRVFIRIDINDVYLNDESIMSCYKTHIRVLLNVDHPTINPLYGVIKTASRIFYTEDPKDIYDTFPQGN